MGTSISVSKNKKRKLHRSLSLSSGSKLPGKNLLSKNKLNYGFLNRFVDDVKLNNIRNSKYSLSNDIKALDFGHYIVKKLWACNFKAPVIDILNAGNARVLDVATGKGSWVMECAETFPWSNFIGVDSVPIFPAVTDVRLMNATFLPSNILDRLFFNDNTFDFVHIRSLNLIFTDKEWKDQVLKELIRVCKPGGWIEVVELDCQYINQGPTHKKVCDAARRYFSDHGVKPLHGEDLAYYLKQTDQVVDIEEEVKNIPYHKGKLGKEFTEHLIKFIQRYKDVILSYMGCNLDEWDETLRIIRKELVDYKTEGVMRRIYCKKIDY